MGHMVTTLQQQKHNKQKQGSWEVVYLRFHNTACFFSADNLVSTVQRHHNTVNVLKNTHNGNSIGHTWGPEIQI